MIQLNTNIIPKGGRILVALSGGIDSVCLLHALHTGAKAMGLTVIAAHYSHGIRPCKAAEETAFIQRLCRSCDIQVHIGRGDVPAYAKAHHMGLEEAARELRYAFLHAMADELECDAIAVAHNLEDNAETMLFNLTRGTGLSGLGGIPAVNGRIIRPMLQVSRREIEAYAREHRLEWLTDESNADQRYSRNRIRHSVLPQLRQINGDADRAMARAAANLAQAQDFILQSAMELLAYDRQPGCVDRRRLRAAHPALYHAVLTLLLREAGADGGILDAQKTGAVIGLALGGRSTGGLDLGRGVKVRLQYTDLCVCVEESRDAAPDGETELTPGVPLHWNGWEILLDAGEGAAFKRSAIEMPVIVRSRRSGDRIAMEAGHKNIKKILIDRKIPAKTRDRIPVICDNNKVLLLGGLETDRRAAGRAGDDVIRIKCRRIKE